MGFRIKTTKSNKFKYQIRSHKILSLTGSKVFGKFKTRKEANKQFKKGLGTKFLTGRVERIPSKKELKFKFFGKKRKINIS